MITELKIEGFKSFGTSARTLKLGPLNFLVGANASGKTNLISALRFLQAAVLQDAEFAVNEFGGITEIRNKILRENKKPKPVEICFKLDLFPKIIFSEKGKKLFKISKVEYAVKLDLRNDSGLPEVESEVLNASIIDNEENKHPFSLSRNKQEVEINDPTAGDGATEGIPRKIKVPEQEKTRLALGVGFFSLPCVVLRKIIDDWRFYNISPGVARLPSKETPDVDLGFAGENLAVILHKIEQQNGKGTEALGSIVAGLKGVVPGFKGIRTTSLPVEKKWAFQILEDKIRGTINPDSVSDGTIRLLALLVIANWSAKQSQLVVIEEPENGVHPHLAEHIVEILRFASESCQVIVTTHNPAFLNYLKPEEVILCDKVNGFTKLQHSSDIDEIKSFQKHFSLGELWTQGRLGGIP